MHHTSVVNSLSPWKGERVRGGVEALIMDLVNGIASFPPHPGPLPGGEGESPAAAWRIELAESCWRLGVESRSAWCLCRRVHRQLASALVFRAWLPPHPGPLPWGEGESPAALLAIENTSTRRSAGRGVPSPCGRGPG